MANGSQVLDEGSIAVSDPVSDAPPRSYSTADQIFKTITGFFAFFVLLIMAAIIVSLFIGALPAIRKFGPGFITSATWNPVTKVFGGLVPIVGTLATSAIALLIAVPVSFGIAMFLTEMCPMRLRRPLGTAIELLAGIPSIIYGMWGLFVFAPAFSEHAEPWIDSHLGRLPLIGTFFSGPPMGIGVLTAGLILRS